MWTSSFLLTFILPLLTTSFLINIDANEEHCYFERLTIGKTFTVMFEVAEGGFLDIDLLITGPTNNVLYKGERETSGKYTFVTNDEGVYTYCFGNKMSSMTNKALMFTIDVKDPNVSTTSTQTALTGHETDDNQKLAEMINELSQQLSAVKVEQEYMQVRERTHRSINENTNQRVTLWAVFEAIALILMTLGQIYYLKRFFESRFVV